MEILGYTGFAVLIFLAVTWTIGVRVKLDAGVHTILGALFFLTATVILTVSGANKLHALWLIPSGFILPLLVSLLALRVPLVFGIFRFVGSVFAGIVRVGISPEKIKAAQEAGLRASIEEFASKVGRTENDA